MKGISRLILLLVFIIFSLQSIIAQSLFFEKVTGKTINPVTQIHGIAKDSAGYIWFGSWNGAYRYDGGSFDLYRHISGDSASLPNNRIRNIVTDQHQGLWLLTFDHKYVRFDYNYGRFRIIPDSLVSDYVANLLNSTSNRINRNSIIDGKRYILSSHHLAALDVRTGQTRQYRTNFSQPGGLEDDYVTCFYIDNQQIIWIGTRSGDIYKANTNRKPFDLHYCHQREEKDFRLLSARVVMKLSGELWIGTNSGILIYDQQGFIKNHPFYNSGSNIRQIRSLRQDAGGNIWIGGIDGLECYYPGSAKIETYISQSKHPELEIRSVFTISRSRSNYIWAGLYNGLARIRLADHHIDFFDLSELVNDHSIMDIVLDKSKHIWLATEGNGVIRLSLEKQNGFSHPLLFNTTLPDRTHRLAGDMVYSLYEDIFGNIWVGTSEGLDCIEKDTLTVQHISFGDNLPTPYISAVTGDGKGNIWISHKKGISKLHMPEREVSTYNIRDKNGNWIFLDGARYKDSSTNSIYFGARTGYVSFNPEKIKTNPFAPELALKSLYVSGKPVIPGDTIRGQVVLQKLLSRTKSIDLKYVNRNFSVEMAAMHYETPGDNMFMYKLEGYDDNWTKTTRNLITYNRIPPGNYIYRAKAISPDALFSLEKDLIIHVHAPWYASFWALSGYVVFILLILLLIYREILSRERLKSQVQLERLKMDKQEELNRDKLEFFTNVSHELRTPLTLIADPLKQLEEKKMPENKQKQYIKVINKNVRQLTELINQLLDFRKAEAGKLTVNYSVCNALKIIRKAAESFSMHAKQRNIQLSIQAEISRVSGYFDQEKLKQVMMNLISNAFKYTPDGGEVSVNISEQCSNGAAELIVIVKDTGIGISPDSLNKIFEPFNNEGSKPFYGNSSGMGMALTHYLVNIMDGQITAESIPGKGTKIILKLPFTRSHAISDAEINNTRDAIYKNVLIESEGNSYLKTSKPTILIVEDNEDLQEYLATELSPEYMLLQEYNGEKGLISAIEMVPDLVVSDVMMPGMDGTQLCKSLKKDEKTSHIPIILLTAKTAEESQIEGLQTGADVYITKPFSVEVLKAQIESMIENRMLLQQKLARIIRIEALETESPQIENVFLKKIVKIIHTHIDSDNFGPEQLADILQISQRQLYRKLKAVSGSTVHEFITRVRMDHAAKLLLDSSLNISEIAYRTGFSEPSNFSRTFSRHFRMSPTQYQKRKRNGN